MTTLISWIGVDSRQASSIYLASDSRITWDKATPWDVGKKLYASKSMPEAFGYCGDVTFPTTVLAQLCEKIDAGACFSGAEAFEIKLELVRAHVERSYRAYPKQHRNFFQIVYVSRTGHGMAASFFAAEISPSNDGEIKSRILPLPSQSGLIEGVGSGRESVNKWYRHWQNSDVNGTSRSVFGAFCDSLTSGDDPSSGGAPQLVGLYRIGNPVAYGIIWENQRHFAGDTLSTHVDLTGIPWRNCRLEECDPFSMSLKEGAQMQPRPAFKY